MLRAFFHVGYNPTHRYTIQAIFSQIKLSFETGKAFLGTSELVEKFHDAVGYKAPALTGTPYKEFNFFESEEKENLIGNRFDMNYNNEKGFRIPAPGGAFEYAVSGWF